MVTTARCLFDRTVKRPPPAVPLAPAGQGPSQPRRNVPFSWIHQSDRGPVPVPDPPPPRSSSSALARRMLAVAAGHGSWPLACSLDPPSWGFQLGAARRMIARLNWDDVVSGVCVQLRDSSGTGSHACSCQAATTAAAAAYSLCVARIVLVFRTCLVQHA